MRNQRLPESTWETICQPFSVSGMRGTMKHILFIFSKRTMPLCVCVCVVRLKGCSAQFNRPKAIEDVMAVEKLPDISMRHDSYYITLYFPCICRFLLTNYSLAALLNRQRPRVLLHHTYGIEAMTNNSHIPTPVLYSN